MFFKRINYEEQVAGQLKRAYPTDAGMDIKSNQDIIVPAGARVVVSTGIAVAIPEGYYGQFASRSGLAFRDGVECFPGILDCMYRGEIKILLRNFSKVPFKVSKGDRIAQLLVIPCATSTPIEVDVLPETDRGDHGFGSSGVK